MAWPGTGHSIRYDGDAYQNRIYFSLRYGKRLLVGDSEYWLPSGLGVADVIPFLLNWRGEDSGMIRLSRPHPRWLWFEVPAFFINLVLEGFA